MSRVWFITGASSGFGRAVAEAAVAAGDVVVGAARRTGALDGFVAAHPKQVQALRLDVTDLAAIRTAVEDTVAWHGRIDVLVNNAGRTHVGAFEETTDAELRALFDLHVFGPAALVRAVLPHMRQRGSGTIVQMSSAGGQVSTPGFAAYSGTKFALEGMSEALAAEVRGFGIKVLIVEPGVFRTELFDSGRAGTSRDLGAYRHGRRGPAHGRRERRRPAGRPGEGGGPDPRRRRRRTPPLRLPLGDDAVTAVLDHLDGVRGDVAGWEKRTRATAFGDA